MNEIKVTEIVGYFRTVRALDTSLAGARWCRAAARLVIRVQTAQDAVV